MSVKFILEHICTESNCNSRRTMAYPVNNVCNVTNKNKNKVLVDIEIIQKWEYNTSKERREPTF